MQNISGLCVYITVPVVLPLLLFDSTSSIHFPNHLSIIMIKSNAALMNILLLLVVGGCCLCWLSHLWLALVEVTSLYHWLSWLIPMICSVSTRNVLSLGHHKVKPFDWGFQWLPLSLLSSKAVLVSRISKENIKLHLPPLIPPLPVS